MTVKRMDNVLIVVDDLEAAKAFFIELGLKFEGESTVEGPLVGSLIGLKDVPGHPRDDADSRWAGH
jgi:catechol 2,3-dioxygenase-like lactoylglutathione lyase family enzyme